MSARVKVARALIVLFDELDNELFRGHQPVHREIEAGEEFTLRVKFATQEIASDDE